jgi:putative inorganic carbon (HCO3(-)) transporter
MLIPALVVAYFWQAGDVMRERATTISQYSSESSAAGRLESWSVAIGMMQTHPVTGVGLASFSTAFPDYSRAPPLEAHSTFFQIAGESGVLAGLMYLLIVAGCLMGLWRNGNQLRKLLGRGGLPARLHTLNEAVLASFAGLVVCSLFLSLQLFEIFYCLAVMTNAVLHVSRKAIVESNAVSAADAPAEAGVIDVAAPQSATPVAVLRPWERR